MHFRLGRLAVACAVVVLSGAACSSRPPRPKPPEPPPAPQPACEEGQTTCCWHQPPGNEWLYACKAPSVPGGVLNVAGGPAQCPGQSCGTPTTDPTPEPPPTGDVPPVGTPVDTNEMLRLGGSTGYVTNGGQEIKPFGCEACCESWAKCPDNQGSPLGTGWPAVSACFIRETAKYGCNIWHLRLAPWASRCGDWNNPECGEPYWVGIGGTYNEDGSFNMEYAATIRAQVWDISQRNGFAEIVIGDDWWFKNACGKEENCQKRLPMSAEAVRAWGKTWHPEHDALFKHWIEQLGPFGRVIFVTGNEEDLVAGTTAEHVQARVDAIRKYEQTVGKGLVHLIGTGSFKPGISADFQVTHENAPVTGPCNGRPCANNEHNPNVSAEEEADRFRKALDAKQRYDAWRAGSSDADWEKRLELFQGIIGGTAPPVGCYAPPQEPEDQWETLGPGPGDRNDEIKAGQAALGSMCKEPKDHANGDAAIEALAAKMREMGYCASKHSDSVTIQSEDDPSIWLEYHAVAPYDTGCWSQRPQDYPHNRHRYKGSAPVAGCSDPLPPKLHTFVLKLEATSWWNGTPIVKNHDYCTAIGMEYMPDGVQLRNECPCRDECPNVKCQERAACERLAMGGLATWRSDGTLRIDETNENRLLAKCSDCTYIEVCNADGSLCSRASTVRTGLAEDPSQGGAYQVTTRER